MAFPIIPKKRSGATGNPSTLQLGELATNTQTGELFLGGDGGVMLLNPPTSAGTTVTEHTGDGTTVAFTFTGYNGTADGGYLVSVGGIDQPPSKYTVTSTAGGTITFVEAPVAGELISIRAIVASGAGGGGITELTGDVTASGTGSVAATLASVTTAQANVGSATAIPVLSVDEKGRVTELTTMQFGGLTTEQIAGLSTTAPAALATAPVVGLSMFAARADHAHKTATVYARTKTVGVDAATIQGCIDLITDAAAQNQAQVLVPPGVYTESLTLKPCVSVVASGQNNGQISTVRIVGNATFTGGATAGDNTLQLIGLTLQTDHATLPALTVTATGGVSTLLHMQDCMVTFSNAATTAKGVEIGSNCAARLINTRTQGSFTAGQGGTHIDVDGGIFYGENYTAEYGTRAMLLRGTNGALKPYGELKWSNISVQGSNALEITSNTALLTMGWVNVNNLSTTGNGITIAAGSVVGTTQCVFAVQAGASNYVVTGAAGSYYYSLGNSYSNATGAPYETKIGASVTQFQYARSYDPASGDLTGTYPSPTLAAITTAQSNVGSGTVIPRLSIDAKGRVTALSTVAMAALTTTQIAGLATTAPSALATAAVVGLSTFAARADHQHVFPTAAQVGALGATAAAGGDLTGNYPSPTLAAITTAQTNAGSATVIPVVSIDAKGRVTALSTVTFAALTTNQIAGLSTAAGAALTTTAIAGVSAFAARADHTHLFPTAADVGALGATAAAGGDLTGAFPNPTLAAITTAQSNIGSSTVVPVLSVDDKGRVTSLTTAQISGGGGGGFTVAALQTESLTIDATFAQKIVPFSAVADVVVTLPADANATITEGSEIRFVNNSSAAKVSFVAGSSATILSPQNYTAISTQYATASATKLFPNTWVLGGSVESGIPTDPFFLQVSLLLHMNGTNGGTTFLDNSPFPSAIQVFGGATTSTAQVKFGTASYLGVTGGYLTTTTNNPFAFGTADYTIECWIRTTSFASQQNILYIANLTGAGFVINTSGQIVFILGNNNRIVSSIIPLNQWVHFAQTRQTSVTRMFINGVLQATTYNDATNYTASGTLWTIGASGATGPIVGNIDDLRITKNICRYTANFTPPIAQFPDA